MAVSKEEKKFETQITSSGWWHWLLWVPFCKNISRNIRIVAYIRYFIIFSIYLSVQSTAFQRLLERTAMQTQYTVLFFYDLAIPAAISRKARAFTSLWTVSAALVVLPMPHLQFLNTLQFLQNEWFFICQFHSTSVSYFFHITHKYLKCRFFSQFYIFFCQLIFVSSFWKT